MAGKCCKEREPVRFKKLRPNAQIPSYKTELAAGMDVSAALKPDTPEFPDANGERLSQMIIIGPGEQALVPTGLAVAIPKGYEMQLRPRSGLALKSEISFTNSPATIDADYRGEIGIIVRNNSKTKSFFVRDGDRIAQAVIAPVPRLDVIEVEDLDETARGEGGFGHTGV